MRSDTARGTSVAFALSRGSVEADFCVMKAGERGALHQEMALAIPRVNT